MDEIDLVSPRIIVALGATAALWRELVIGFASQLGELRLGFTQLAALYVLADGSSLTSRRHSSSPSRPASIADGATSRCDRASPGR